MAKGYHLNDIPKGELGKWSKITEEWAEFEDAKQQGSKILMLVELADVFGAIKAFHKAYSNSGDAIIAVNQELRKLEDETNALGIDRKEIILFAEITARAFESGERK
jgi:hypothetical protein